jgi:uncharacterized membrane protein
MHKPSTISNSAPRLGLGSQPVYAALVQFPVVCFIGALLTDIAYYRSGNYMWNDFSAWLVTIGCVMAGLTAVGGLITWLHHRHVRTLPLAGLHVAVSLAVLVVAIFNAFVHSRDAFAVMPTGLILSAIVVALMLLATWLGWPRTHAHATYNPNDNGAA